MKVILKLDNLNAIKKNLTQGKKKKHLTAVTKGVIIPDMIDNWLKAKGGDGKAMPPLSEEYAEDKKSGKVLVGSQFRGGQPIRNLTLSGDMQRAIEAGSNGQDVKIYFKGRKEAEKAAANHWLSNEHMMKVSKKIVKRATDMFKKLIMRK